MHRAARRSHFPLVMTGLFLVVIALLLTGVVMTG